MELLQTYSAKDLTVGHILRLLRCGQKTESVLHRQQLGTDTLFQETEESDLKKKGVLHRKSNLG